MCVEVVQKHIESTGYCSWDENTTFQCRNYAQTIDSGILEYYFYIRVTTGCPLMVHVRYHFVTTFGCFWYDKKNGCYIVRYHLY